MVGDGLACGREGRRSRQGLMEGDELRRPLIFEGDTGKVCRVRDSKGTIKMDLKDEEYAQKTEDSLV